MFARVDALKVMADFSNFDSLKSTETVELTGQADLTGEFQQFRLVEEY